MKKLTFTKGRVLVALVLALVAGVGSLYPELVPALASASQVLVQIVGAL